MRDQEPLPVVVNSGGGTASREGEELEQTLRGAFAGTGRPIDLHLVEGQDLAETIESLAGQPRVAVGGGDGTLGTAAGILAASGTEFAVLPLGTRNHFARQLGVPLDVGEAAVLAVTGTAAAVDLGQAGKRTFLNNASLGAYVELVRAREASGLGKLSGSLVAGWQVLRRLRARQYRLSLDGEARDVQTVQLFVGNNRYKIEEGKPGERDSITDGLLSVFATAPISRLGLLRTAWRMAIGKPDMTQDFALEAEVRVLVIEGEGRIGIAVDGEECSLCLPLRIESRPGALKVVVPG